MLYQDNHKIKSQKNCLRYCYMSKVIVDASREDNYSVAIVDNSGKLDSFLFESNQKKTIKSNIYLGKVTRIEYSLQAAFVEYGGNKAGFLPFGEIHPNYYQLPIKDKKEIENALKNEEKDNENEEDKDDDYEIETDNTNSKELSQNSYKIYQKYNIQEVIKRGQPVLVQVYKDERGNKGASLTTYISIPGRYCVLMPNSPRGIGLSKKVFSYEERKRVLSAVRKFKSPDDNMRLIIRTAGMKVDVENLKKDYEYLKDLWKEISTKAIQSSVNGVPIYQEINVVEQVIRDAYESDEKSEIIISGEKCYNDVVQFAKKIMPNEVGKIKQYTNKTAIFKKYEINKKLDELLNPNASLPSGGYLVINPTEALVSVDVNSGKSIHGKNVEETAIKTNIEAAHELARQLRLRNLGGLIVVDFIDMAEPKNRHLLERELQKAFMNDKAKIQFAKISQFGLVEISRQRMHSSIAEMLTIQCPHCYGTGLIKAPSVISVDIINSIEEQLCNSNFVKQEFLEVLAQPEVINDLVIAHIKEIENIQKQYNIKIITTKHPFEKNEEYVLRTTNELNNHTTATELYHAIAAKYEVASPERKEKSKTFKLFEKLFRRNKDSK